MMKCALMVKGDTVQLVAGATIIVPALCMARIPHEMIAEACKQARIYLFPEPDTFSRLNLLIGAYPVLDGEVITHVFNLSHAPVKVRKGDNISRLVAL